MLKTAVSEPSFSFTASKPPPASPQRGSFCIFMQFAIFMHIAKIFYIQLLLRPQSGAVYHGDKGVAEANWRHKLSHDLQENS